MNNLKTLERACNSMGISISTALVTNLEQISESKAKEFQRVLKETLAGLSEKEVFDIAHNVWNLKSTESLNYLFDKSVKKLTNSIKRKAIGFSRITYEENDSMYFITLDINQDKYVNLWVNFTEKKETDIELITSHKKPVPYNDKKFKEILAQELKDFYTINVLFYHYNYDEFHGKTFDYEDTRLQLQQFVEKY